MAITQSKFVPSFAILDIQIASETLIDSLDHKHTELKDSYSINDHDNAKPQQMALLHQRGEERKFWKGRYLYNTLVMWINLEDLGQLIDVEHWTLWWRTPEVEPTDEFNTSTIHPTEEERRLWSECGTPSTIEEWCALRRRLQS